MINALSINVYNKRNVVNYTKSILIFTILTCLIPATIPQHAFAQGEHAKAKMTTSKKSNHHHSTDHTSPKMHKLPPNYMGNDVSRG